MDPTPGKLSQQSSSSSSRPWAPGKPGWLILVALLGWLAPVAPAAAQTTVLVLNSEPGDFIGGGVNQTITAADGVFSASRNFHEGVNIEFAGEGINFWTLNFAAPGHAPLTVGVYENATRFPFQESTSAGLNVAGQGRGCNTLTGRFEVLEVVYGEGGEVISFAADFEQHCEGATPALFGSIRFNAGPTPKRCRSDMTSLAGLEDAVLALNTSRASRETLKHILVKAQAAQSDERPDSTRQWILIFLQQVVNRAELKEKNPQRIAPPDADVLICGAANVLVNLMSP